jgi:hypothetical protein
MSVIGGALLRAHKPAFAPMVASWRIRVKRKVMIPLMFLGTQGQQMARINTSLGSKANVMGVKPSRYRPTEYFVQNPLYPDRA